MDDKCFVFCRKFSLLPIKSCVPGFPGDLGDPKIWFDFSPLVYRTIAILLSTYVSRPFDGRCQGAAQSPRAQGCAAAGTAGHKWLEKEDDIQRERMAQVSSEHPVDRAVHASSVLEKDPGLRAI